MASLQQLRQRLRSAQSTKQIMRAMQQVSASKLKRAQGRMLQARSTLEFLDGLLQRVLAATPPLTHPLCATREGAEALVIFTSDAGLCGAYNTNLIQLAESHLTRDTLARPRIIYIGKKGYRYFTKRGFAAAESYLDLAGRPNLAKAEEIGRHLMGGFLSGTVASIQLLSARFVSATTSKPAVRPWLPIQLDSSRARELVSKGQVPTSLRADEPTSEQALDYIFEPSPARVFEDLLPRWALATFQLVMLEAFTSEHSARMIAMKNATDNAEELMRALTLQRNKIRQASITKELSEIVGTAEALK